MEHDLVTNAETLLEEIASLNREAKKLLSEAYVHNSNPEGHNQYTKGGGKSHEDGHKSHGHHGPGHELEHSGHQAHQVHDMETIHHGLVDTFGGGHHATAAIHDAHQATEAAHAAHAAHGATHAAGHAASHDATHGAAHGHGADLADVGAIAARHAYGPALKAISTIMQKVPGAKRTGRAIAAIHEGATKLADKAIKKMVERYGEATAGAILGAGSVLSHTVTHGVGIHGPGGHAIPGPQFIGAIPLLALAEAGKRLGVVGKDTKLEKAVSKVGAFVHAIKRAVGKGGSALASGGLKAAHAAGRVTGATIRAVKSSRAMANNQARDDYGYIVLNEEEELTVGDDPTENDNNSPLEVTANDLITLNEVEVEQAAKEFMEEYLSGFRKLLEKHGADLHAAQGTALDLDDDEDEESDEGDEDDDR